MEQTTLKTSLKVLLSFWILYHFVGILIMPMPQSILTKSWAGFFRPYLNQLNINTTWNLFSPEPAQPLWMRVGIVSEEFETGMKDEIIPQFKNQVDRNPSHRREYYQMRSMLLDETRIYDFFIPWYCKKYPKAQEIMLETYRRQPPNLEQAHLDPRHTVQELTLEQMVKEYKKGCHHESEEAL